MWRTCARRRRPRRPNSRCLSGPNSSPRSPNWTRAAAARSCALRTAELARRLARQSPGARLAGQRERVRGLIGRLARLRPLLIERPRRSAEAVGRTFVREGALMARRRGEQAESLTRLGIRRERAYDER